MRLAYSWKEINRFCFVLLCIWGQFPSTSPPEVLYSEGRFNGGFYALGIWRAYIWKGLYKEGLTFGILRYIIETINTFIHPVVPSKTIPDSRPKWAKCIPVFRPNRRKNPTRWVREYPPGLPDGMKRLSWVSEWVVNSQRIEYEFKCDLCDAKKYDNISPFTKRIKLAPSRKINLS